MRNKQQIYSNLHKYLLTKLFIFVIMDFVVHLSERPYLDIPFFMYYSLREKTRHIQKLASDFRNNFILQYLSI